MALLALAGEASLVAAPGPVQLKAAGFPPADGTPGEVVLTGSIPKAFSPNATKQASITVTLTPEQPPEVMHSGLAKFEVSGREISVHIPCQRSSVTVKFSVWIEVPAKSGGAQEFTATGWLKPKPPAQRSPDQVTPVTNGTTVPQGEGPVMPNPPGVSRKETGGVKHLELVLTGSRKARVRIIVRSAMGGQQYEQRSDVDTTPVTVVLAGPVFDKGTIAIYEDGPDLLDGRPPAQEVEIPPGIPSPSREWVLYTVVGAALVLLAGGAVLLVRARRRSRKRKENPARNLPPIQDQIVQQAISAARAAETTAQRVEKEQKQLQQDLIGLRDQVKSSSQRTGYDNPGLGKPSDIQAFASALASHAGWKGAPPSSAQPAGPPPNEGEVRLLAVANRWLETGSGDREKMRDLLSAMKLQATWYCHKDLVKIFADVGNYAYDFEPSERNGGWLWLAIEGSSDVLAVPADVTFFQIGKAPEFLERLFDGMENAREGFRFARFYRACRLRPASTSGYSLAAKGLLQLQNEPAPASPPPFPYESLLSPSFRSTHAAAQFGSQPSHNAIPLLRTAMERIWEEIKALQYDLGEVRSTLTTAAPPPAVAPPVDEDAIKALIKTEVDKGGKAYEDAVKALIKTEVERETKVYEDRLGWLEKKIDAVAFRIGALVKQGVKPPPLPSPPVALPQVAAPVTLIEAGVRTDPPVAEKQEPSRTNFIPAVEVKETSGVSVDSALLQSLSDPPQRTFQPPALGSTDAPIVSPLPGDWQDLLDRAARDKESQLKPNQKSADNYLSRLHRLRYYFDEYLRKRTKSPSIPVRVVHMLHHDGRFVVHDTQTIGDPAVRSCKICDTVPFPQLVLCFGGDGAETLHILLPYGTYVESHYPNLYQLILFNPPAEQSFEINAIQSPAILRRGSQRSGPYGIVERMRWSR